MRLHELTSVADTSPESSLVTALELLQHRYADKKIPAKISTNALINLILNTDKNFDYNALVTANDRNPAVKNLIKSFNRKEIILQPVEGDSPATMSNAPSGQVKTGPVDTVANMAKRAAKTRGAAI